ncbi:MAG: DUF6119 family protein [Porcipelethomonas sp.]
MSTINLYKIDNGKSREFYNSLREKMEEIETIERDRSTTEETHIFSCTLYLSVPDEEKAISWNWILRDFNKESITAVSSPKAVLVIEHNYDAIYAITFGHAFFLVDKFCDRDFGFTFGRKLQYEEIKTTTLTTPGLQRNKVVNTYINYSELEFDSGESFAKLKAKEVLPDGFSLYKSSLEIGTSIRFNTESDSLENIIDLICYVEKTIENEDDKCKIPVFSKINDKVLIAKLEEMLRDQIRQGQANINISELDIIGVTEVFNNNDGNFKLRYKRQEKEVSILNENSIREFCEENDINFDNNVLDIMVISYYNGESVSTNTIHDMIDYIMDSEKCLLSKGIWYKYNDDYLTYLRDSLAEISTEYHLEYDFSSDIYDQYIEELFATNKNNSEYHGQAEKTIINSLKKKHYKERAFNELRERDNGFKNYDRKTTRIGKNDIEAMDLYKDKCMFAVKIGNTSAKLCYVVDQSLTSLKMYKAGKLPNIPAIDTVAIWIVLERKTHIEREDGKPDINLLDMLMLKNRLDQWKKEVRIQGFKPLIWINYVNY